MAGIVKYSIGDLTLIAIRCNDISEIVTLEDFLYDGVREEIYSKVEVSTILAVLGGKKAYFEDKT